MAPKVKELEEKLRAAERLGYVGGMVSKLAHELRNPLNTISVNLQLLEEDLAKSKDEKVIKRLQTSRKEINRLEHLLSDFLRFAKPAHLDLKPVDMNHVLGGFIEFFTPTAERNKIKLVALFGKELPPVMLDEKLFKSAIMNLVLNSTVAMPDGGTITFRTRLRKDRVLVAISDTGIGIPAEKLPKVFDVFFTTRDGGTGLGLPITRRAIEDLGGTITLDSTPGMGTTAILSLPISV
jgi:two-component system sensor histidine kinase HydH